MPAGTTRRRERDDDGGGLEGDLIHLSSGPLTMLFDPSNAFLRYVRLGDQEVLRGVFGAVRNRNWDTVGPDIRNVQVDERRGAFTVTFDAICCDGDAEFTWRGEIAGAADGHVSYLFDGEAKTPFLKNRIGLCVLHPIRECAGRPCRIEHVDGRVTDGAFPQLIAPHQPFTSMRSIAHTVKPGVDAVVTLEGDVFEMEDQRNWTDASFKTYSTPLNLPFPVRIDAGARVRQAVSLRLDRCLRLCSPQSAPSAVRVVVAPPPARRRVPIGFGINGTPGEGAQATLAALRPDHLRVDLVLASSAWRARLLEASRAARRAGAKVHAALFLSDAGEQELEAIRAEVDTGHVPIGMWLVFHAAEKSTSGRWITLAHRVLGTSAPVAAGSNAYFAELNRNRPPLGAPAMPCFSINPQVHAFDDLSLLETLEAQPDTVQTARSFCPWPVVISPVTLRPRFNPNATDAADDTPPESDARQTTLFGAVWTMGTLARLATSPNVRSLTFFETTGPRGVMDDSGRLYPMGQVFAALAGCDEIVETVPDAPQRVAAIGLVRRDGGRRVLVAALDTSLTPVVFEGLSGLGVCRVLGEDGFAAETPLTVDGGRLELELPPMGIILLDIGPHGADTPAGGARPA